MEKQLEQYELKQRLETVIKDTQAELEKRTRQTLEEVEAELKLLANFKISSQKFEKPNQNPFEKHKEAIKLGIAALGALAAFAYLSLPVGLAVAGVGTVINHFVGKLRSKHKRRSEAISHICNELTKQLSTNEEKVLEQTQQQIETCSETMSTAVDNYFQ